MKTRQGKNYNKNKMALVSRAVRERNRLEKIKLLYDKLMELVPEEFYARFHWGYADLLYGATNYIAALTDVLLKDCKVIPDKVPQPILPAADNSFVEGVDGEIKQEVERKKGGWRINKRQKITRDHRRMYKRRWDRTRIQEEREAYERAREEVPPSRQNKWKKTASEEEDPDKRSRRKILADVCRMVDYLKPIYDNTLQEMVKLTMQNEQLKNRLEQLKEEMNA